MENQYLHDLRFDEDDSHKTEITVSRKWCQREKNGRVHGVNLIFVDKYDNRSHGWIPLTCMEAVAYKLEEGNDYILSNFSVQPFNLKYRCFEAEIQVVLNKNTDITLLRSSTSVIPRDVFYFTNLRNLTTDPGEIACLIDVVGIIQDLKPLEPLDGPRGETHFYREFYLTDLIHRVKVRFWDQFALRFEELFNEELTHPRTITISSCEILKNQFTGEISLRDAEPTRMYFKFKSCMEDNLRKRLWEVNGLE